MINLFHLWHSHPVPGKDAIWLAFCKHCGDDDMQLFVSRGGYKDGGVEHCYICGTERKTTGVKEEYIARGILSTWCHWQKYSIFPYNWHRLTEAEKHKLLFAVKKRC